MTTLCRNDDKTVDGVNRHVCFCNTSKSAEKDVAMSSMCLESHKHHMLVGSVVCFFTDEAGTVEVGSAFNGCNIFGEERKLSLSE